MLRLIKNRDARVRAHSWAGAMVTDNAALDDWRCVSRLPCRSCPGQQHRVTGSRERARVHTRTPSVFKRGPPRVYAVYLH